jgi:peptidyl-prolyl cis-trans isomerase-like protein 2
MQTTSAAAGSFTSTTLTPVTVNQIAALSEEEEARQRYDYLKTVKKQKGYVQLQTSHGSINVELHCDSVPMTCENFITLCERNYYRGLPFHRIIKNFMLQVTTYTYSIPLTTSLPHYFTTSLPHRATTH